MLHLGFNFDLSSIGVLGTDVSITYHTRDNVDLEGDVLYHGDDLRSLSDLGDGDKFYLLIPYPKSTDEHLRLFKGFMYLCISPINSVKS